jgi:hypothetical protein
MVEGPDGKSMEITLPRLRVAGKIFAGWQVHGGGAGWQIFAVSQIFALFFNSCIPAFSPPQTEKQISKCIFLKINFTARGWSGTNFSKTLD